MRTIPSRPKQKPKPQSPTIIPILSPTPHTPISITTTHTLAHIHTTLAPTHSNGCFTHIPPTHTGGLRHIPLYTPRTDRPNVPAISVFKCAGIHTRPRGGVCPGATMSILSIISILSILSINITQATFICYIKGDKVMCYIEQKIPRPRSPRTARHTNRTPVRAGPYNLMYGTRPVYPPTHTKELTDDDTVYEC